MENKRLGKGLEQLFSNERLDFDSMEKEIVSTAKENDIVEISLDEIRSNPYQPRRTFNAELLQELAASIKEHGVIQPIIVKKSVKGYELVAGERRTKASRLAGLTTIPAIIKEFDDQEMMEIALIENIQREDLTPIEEAKAYERVLNVSSLTQDELATKFGKSRSYITNILGLLRLPEDIQILVDGERISMAHAKILSKLASVDQINNLAKRIIDEKISVRELERLTSEVNYVRQMPLKKVRVNNQRYQTFEDTMREKIGTKVRINDKKIIIPFDSDKDLERILEIININFD